MENQPRNATVRMDYDAFLNGLMHFSGKSLHGVFAFAGNSVVGNHMHRFTATEFQDTRQIDGGVATPNDRHPSGNRNLANAVPFAQQRQGVVQIGRGCPLHRPISRATKPQPQENCSIVLAKLIQREISPQTLERPKINIQGQNAP